MRCYGALDTIRELDAFSGRSVYRHIERFSGDA